MNDQQFNVGYRVSATASLVHGTRTCGKMNNADPERIVEVAFDAPHGFKTSREAIIAQLPEGTKTCSCFNAIWFEERTEPQTILTPSFAKLDMAQFRHGSIPISCPYCGHWEGEDEFYLFRPDHFDMMGHWIGTDIFHMVCSNCYHPISESAKRQIEGAMLFMGDIHFYSDKSLSAGLLAHSYRWLLTALQRMSMDKEANKPLKAEVAALSSGVCSGKPRTGTEIGAVLGITGGRSNQLLHVAKRTLRWQLSKDPLNPVEKLERLTIEVASLKYALLSLLPHPISEENISLLTQPIDVLDLLNRSVNALNDYAWFLQGRPNHEVFMTVAELIQLVYTTPLHRVPGLGTKGVQDVIETLSQAGLYRNPEA